MSHLVTSRACRQGLHCIQIAKRMVNKEIYDQQVIMTRDIYFGHIIITSSSLLCQTCKRSCTESHFLLAQEGYHNWNIPDKISPPLTPCLALNISIMRAGIECGGGQEGDERKRVYKSIKNYYRNVAEQQMMKPDTDTTKEHIRV